MFGLYTVRFLDVSIWISDGMNHFSIRCHKKETGCIFIKTSNGDKRFEHFRLYRITKQFIDRSLVEFTLLGIKARANVSLWFIEKEIKICYGKFQYSPLELDNTLSRIEFEGDVLDHRPINGDITVPNRLLDICF